MKREHRQAFFGHGRWFMCPEEIHFIRVKDGKTLKPISYGARWLLAFLLGHFDYLEREGKLVEDWFYCRSSTIHKKLGMTRGAQQALLHELVEHGFIETERRGMPPARYVRIDFDEIFTAIERGREVGIFDESEDQT